MKKELRVKFKEKRNLNINNDETICDKLYQLVKNYKNIAVYLSLDNEVNLEKLITKLLVNSNVYVPYVKKPSKILEFRQFTTFDNLIFDDAKILSSPILPVVNLNSIDVVIMSCLACNFDGYRLGYGGGYYDQTLKNYQGVKIGVVYDNCLTTVKFQDDYDIILDYLVTEKQVIVINKELNNV